MDKGWSKRNRSSRDERASRYDQSQGPSSRLCLKEIRTSAPLIIQDASHRIPASLGSQNQITSLNTSLRSDDCTSETRGPSTKPPMDEYNAATQTSDDEPAVSDADSYFHAAADRSMLL